MHCALISYAQGIDSGLCAVHKWDMVTKEELKKLRNDRKETQAEFAAHFGVDQATIQRWETRGIPVHPVYLRQVGSDVIERIIESLKPQEAAE